MRFAYTLKLYLARMYGFYLFMMTGILWGLVYLADTIELLRRASKKDGVSLSMILEMGFLKLPAVGSIVIPFAVLFAAMMMFWTLARRHELAVMRASGFSVWEFLSPVLAVATAAGFVMMMLVNPVGAAFVSKFRAMEAQYLARSYGLAQILDQGLWLRQSEDEVRNGGYVILHAGTVKMPEWRLQNVMALVFGPGDELIRRVDAPAAGLAQGQWIFEDARVNEAGKEARTYPKMSLKTNLTTADIEESFASPETISFWHLPGFIRVVESTGFEATRLKIHFQTLMAQPLLFFAMVLLAATVALRPPRQGGIAAMIGIGVVVGFMTFFMSSFLQALGASHQIPVVLSAWSAPFILTLLGVSILLGLEDG